jgi:2-polyprenyl-3-methyl-5-hydroxy-6-metoxy-1,4-benzoquinol methylase
MVMPKPLSLLFDCSSLVVGGGIQAGLSALTFATRAQDLDIHLASSPQFWTEVPSTIRQKLASSIVGTAHKAILRLRFTSELSKYERRLRPDAVFTVFGPAYWRSTAPRLQGFALPRVIYPEVRLKDHSMRFPQISADRIAALAKKHFLSRAKDDWFVVETETVRHRLKRHVGISADRIFVIGNTYSPHFLPPVTAAPRSNPTAFNVLVPSSYYPHKNLEFIPAVAKRMSDVHGLNVMFTFCIPRAHPGWKRVLNIARRLGVESSIRTAEHVPHTRFAALYAQSDAAFLPTLLECSTAVYPESFMAGVPVVTTDADFSRELCGEAALYCDPTDASDAAAKLASVLLDQHMRAHLIRAGADQLRNSYLAPEDKWQSQLNLLRKLIDSRRAHKTAATTATTPVPKPRDAVVWHGEIAPVFASRYRRSDMFVERVAVWRAMLAAHVRPKGLVLDLGCGAGIFAVIASRIAEKVIAVDGSKEMLELARREAGEHGVQNIEFVQCRLEVFNRWIAHPADLIICSSVLEYLEDANAFLSACAQALKPAGKLIISTPNGDSLYRKFERALFKLTGRPRYFAYVRSVETTKAMSARLSAAGFEITEARHFGSVPLLSTVLRMIGGEKRSSTLTLFVAVRR